MKNRTSNLFRIRHFFYALLVAVIFYACHDTRSFENVRKIKIGMTITEIENSMGEPIVYDYINDSTESREYVYDNAGNGIDKYINVIYENGKAKSIKNYCH